MTRPPSPRLAKSYDEEFALRVDEKLRQEYRVVLSEPIPRRLLDALTPLGATALAPMSALPGARTEQFEAGPMACLYARKP